MKPRTAILLVVILLGFIGLILVRHTDIFTPPGPGPETEGQQSVWQPIADADQLTIERANGEPIRFVKDANDWRITEPIDARAWAYMIEDMVIPLEKLACIKVFAANDPESPGLKLTGLDSPRWTLTLSNAQGEKRVLEVGRAVPLSRDQQTYVRPAGSEQIYAVAYNFTEKLSRTLTEYRNRIVVEIDKSSIDRIRIDGQQTVELIKRDGTWAITAPINAAADANAVDELLRKITRFKVNSFLDDSPTSLIPYGLAPGSERLIVRFWVEGRPATTAPTTQPAEPPRSYAIALGNKKHTKGERYAKLLDSPGVFLVRVSTIDDLNPSLLSLRDKKLLPAASKDIVGVELDMPHAGVQLAKTDGQWQMVQPFAGKANDQAVTGLLNNLGELKAESFRDDVATLGGFGLDTPTGKITIQQAGDDTQTLLIGTQSPSGEMTFVKRSASEAVAVVKSGDLAALLRDIAEYWNTNLFEIPPDEKLTGIKLSRADGEFVLVQADGRWTITAPFAAATDDNNVGELVGKLRTLNARQIKALGREAAGEYMDAPDRITVELHTVAKSATEPTTTPAQPAVSTVAIGAAKVGAKAYAWREGAEPLAVGEFDMRLFDKLSAELRERTIWKIEPGNVESIKIVAGDQTLELQRDGGDWKYTADTYVKIDGKKVKSFLQTIQQMQAQKFATHDAPDAKQMATFGMDDPWLEFTLTRSDGDDLEMLVAPTGPDNTATRYGLAKGIRGVLVLTSETATKLAKKLEDFKQ